MFAEQAWGRLASWCAACAWVVAGWFPGDNPDTYGHLALGREMLALRAIPTHDSWSLFDDPARVFRNYEWLAELIFAALYEAWGYNALIALKSALLFAALLMWGGVARSLGGARAELLGAFFLVANLPVARDRLTERPHLFAFTFTALYVLGHVRMAQPGATNSDRTRWLVALAATHVIWVNVHGSHLLGVGVTALFLLGAWEQRRTYATMLALQAAACFVTPYGPSIVIEAVQTALDPRWRDLITEWQPWTPQSPPQLLIVPIANATVLAVLAPRMLRATGAMRAALLLAACVAVLAVRSIRFVADFLLLASPLLGAGLAPFTMRWSGRLFAPASFAITVVSALLVPTTFTSLPPKAPIGFGESTLDRPAVSGALLRRARGKARVFGSLADSWYLEFAAPDEHFFIDGRAQFFGPEHVILARHMFADPALFEQMRARFRLNAFIVRHTLSAHTALLTHLERDPRYRLVALELHHALYVSAPLAAELRVATLEPLAPGFRSRFVLAASEAERARIRAALAQLPEHANTHAYRRWVGALLALAPFARGAAELGLEPPTNARELAVLRSTLPGLKLAATQTEAPSVYALYGLVAALACELKPATEALTSAFRAGPSPLVLFALQELALRRGEVKRVAAFLRAAPRDGAQARWLHSLEQQVNTPPQCPFASVHE